MPVLSLKQQQEDGDLVVRQLSVIMSFSPCNVCHCPENIFPGFLE